MARTEGYIQCGKVVAVVDNQTQDGTSSLEKSLVNRTIELIVARFSSSFYNGSVIVVVVV